MTHIFSQVSTKLINIGTLEHEIYVVVDKSYIQKYITKFYVRVIIRIDIITCSHKFISL